MRSRWIAVVFVLLFVVFLIDALTRLNAPLFDPTGFQFESKLIYLILASAGLGALLLFLLIAFFPPRVRYPGSSSDQNPAAPKTRRITQLQTALQLGDWKQALSLLQQVQKDDADYWSIQKIKGDIHATRGEWGAAMTAYREALHQGSPQDHALLFLSLGHAYEQQDQFDQAKDLYRQALQNAPGSLETIERLRHLAVREQDWTEAMKSQEAIEQLNIDRDELPQESNFQIGIRYELARQTVEDGNIKMAQALLKYIFRSTAYFTPAYLLQGEIQRKQHGPLAGLKTYEQGFKATQHPVMLKRIAETWLLDNQPQRAIDFLREIIRSHPGDARAAFCLGDLFRKLEMSSEALKIFESIRRNHPDWLLNSISLAELYEREGETKKALQLYRGIVDTSEALSAQPWQCYSCNTTYPEYKDLCVVCFDWNSVNLNQNKAGILDFGYEKSTALPL